MGIKVERVKRLLERKIGDKRGVDFLKEVTQEWYTYDRSALLADDILEIRNYSDIIHANYSPEDFADDTNDGDEELDADENGTSAEDRRGQYILRSNKRRLKNVRYLAKMNTDLFTTYVTLTMGLTDYHQLLKNRIENGDLCKEEISDNVLDFYYDGHLKGIKKLWECDENNDEKLDPVFDEIRKKLIFLLGKAMNKIKTAEKIVKERFADTFDDLPDWRKRRKIMDRELPRQLDELICNKDPFDIDDAEDLFDNFRRTINNYLQDENFEVKKLEYLKTIELQQSGRIHFNLLCNLPRIKQWRLQRKWGNGIVFVTSIHSMAIDNDEITIRKKESITKKIQKLVDYVTKEIVKAVEKVKYHCFDIELKDNHLYDTSNNIKRPIKITACSIIDKVIKKHIERNKYKPDSHEKISSDVEYGHDFDQIIYKLEGDTLQKEIEKIERELGYSMIEKAEKRGQKEVTQDIIDEVFHEHDLSLLKDFNRKNSTDISPRDG